ncbi:ATP synthase subunit delta [Acidocella aquatica]|uniref:ATP synthase subunit delta n=1 Tax=Acidocella aquatica TaxID=1922313 RepID=A0ABQ6ABE9_9PROT|nr:ATP synthase F1 subunit delta [Acidocella aquatica]GLR68888.1 ATP synthase subunit delta [Acidocella aquatica]
MVDITGTGETGLSARYAAALYALAFDQNILTEVIGQMAALGSLIAQSPELKRLVGNPLTDAGRIAPALTQALSEQGFLPIIRNFVNVVIANRRLAELPALITGFAAYVAAKRGEVVASVTSAQPLSGLQRSQLTARLTEAGYGSVKLIEHTDASLLGGMVLQIGAKLFDTSLKSRLNRLNYSLKGAA